MSLLNQLIEQYVLEVDEPDLTLASQDITRELLRADPEELVILLAPIIRSHVIHVMRTHTLNTEKRSHLEHLPQTDPVADRLAFLQERFYCPGIGFITWGQATITHHEKRIAYLQKKADGLEATMLRHSEAIMEIQTKGVKCLNDIHKKARKRSA